MRKKIFVIFLIFALSMTVLAACKPKKQETKVTYKDIFAQNDGISLKSFDKNNEISLPEGVVPYYTVKNGAKDYTKAYDEKNGIVFCSRTETVGDVSHTYYGFVSVEARSLIAKGCAYDSNFGALYGMIYARDVKEDECVLMNVHGDVLFRKSGEKDPTVCFKPLSRDYVAVKYLANEYRIYSVSSLKKGDSTPLFDGMTFADNSDSDYSTEFKAFDDYIAVLTYKNPTFSYGAKKLAKCTVYGVSTGNRTDLFRDAGEYSSSVTRGAFYLGQNVFYCYEQTSSDEEDGYQYKVAKDKEYEEGEETEYDYYKISIWTFDTATGAKRTIAPDRIFSTIINSYYEEEVSRNVSAYINDGYSYVSVGYLRADDKTVSDEQYIIDSNLNIYLSLVEHAGSATNYDARSEDYRDVLLTYSGGYGFSTENKGDILVYDDKGNTVLRVEGTFSKVFYNNGIVTAIEERTDEKNDTIKRFVAYKLDGTNVVSYDAGYDDLSGVYSSDRIAFIGKYAVVRKNRNYYLVDSSGNDAGNPDISDMYVSSGTAYFFSGVYMSKDKTTGKLGLKTYDGTAIYDNVFSSAVIDKRNFGNVVFYGCDADGNWMVYLVR